MNVIPVVLAFTPNYIIPAVTTIQSILTSSSNEDKFEIICLLTEKFSNNTVSELQNWCSKRLTFKFLMLDNVLEGIYIDERFTAAASFRLLLPDILPYYKKVIYLDCDIIVRNNLSTLYNDIDLQDNYLGAVYEATLDFQIPYVNKLGLQEGRYFNSGVLLMNLEMMRKDELVSDLIQKSNNPDSEFPDQDALNSVCQGRVLPLSPIYNSIRTFYLPQYKSTFLKYYSNEEWDAIQEYGTIHYTGAKPWNAYSIQFTTWWRSYEKLPYSIKKLGKVSWRLHMLSKLLKQPILLSLINTVQSLYRKFK